MATNSGLPVFEKRHHLRDHLPEMPVLALLLALTTLNRM